MVYLPVSEQLRACEHTKQCAMVSICEGGNQSLHQIFAERGFHGNAVCKLIVLLTCVYNDNLLPANNDSISL